MDLYGTNNMQNMVNMFSFPQQNHQSPSRQKPDDNYSYIKIPLLGRVRCIKDKNGMMCLLFVYIYWIYGTWASVYIVLLPAYNDGHVSSFFIYFYLSVALLCLGSLIRASTLNPGRLPNIDDLQIIEGEEWTFCPTCNRKRPPRAHHCRRCRQCVTRMDHHCPWINNCVGEENHYAFILLLLYAFLLGLLSFIICMMHFWVLPRCVSCDREVFYIKHSIWFMYLLTILGLNMALVMGVQFFSQHLNVLIDRTILQNMQSMPEEGSVKVRDTFKAYKDLFGTNAVVCWLLPCRRRKTRPVYIQHPV
ncbi:hypothetical protein SNE40_011826 [Patella caerulea]|uniref:Palmitoyltransferase n=1 Tax=Patella caerulea TaxID=87958 RepID=A0AAN8PYK7_PATCE